MSAGSVVGSTAVTASEDTSAVVQHVLEVLEIESAPCPDELRTRFRESVVTWCGQIDRTPREFRKAWKRKLINASRPVIGDASHWTRDRQLGLRHYFTARGGLFMVTFRQSDGLVLLASTNPWRKCEESARANGSSWMPSVEFEECVRRGACTKAERIASGHPSYPEAARSRRVPGLVQMWMLIDPTGSPKQICVTTAVPPGLRFRRGICPGGERVALRAGAEG